MTTPAPARPDVAHRVFSDGRLSIGLTLPLLRTGHIVADFDEQLELAALADALGFRALWIRDVPLNSADYPDPVGHLDPWVLLGALAARTRRIALASGAIVLPLRHPLHIAKGALSVATLSGGRFILGSAPATARLNMQRSASTQNAARPLPRPLGRRRAALGVPSRVVPDEAPPDAPEFTLLPRGADAVPMLAVGSGGQSVDWIARHSLGWMTYHRDPDTQRARYVARGGRPARDARLSRVRRIDAARPRRGSRCAGHRIAARLCNRTPRIDRHPAGHARRGHHVTLNPPDRPVREVIEEIAEHVLPVFHDGA